MQPKSKNAMDYRKWTVREEEHVNLNNINLNAPAAVRQNLPRRCKAKQPYYGEDIDIIEDESNNDVTLNARNKKNKASAASSSSDIASPARQETEMTLTVLSWLIDMNVVKEDSAVRCLDVNTKQVLAVGKIKRNGILCSCCLLVIPASKFSNHRTGFPADDDKPYQNIFLEGMEVSLSTCLIEAWNRHSVPAKNGYYHVVKRPRVRDDHDDSCMICADGGNLMCCEKCPSTYHPKCVGFEGVPQDEWHCPYCHCKYCDSDSGLLLTCFQCSKKYHCHCCGMERGMPSSCEPSNIPLCGWNCWQVYRNLELMVGRTIPTRFERVSFKLVRRMDLDPDGQYRDGMHNRATNNSLVALAAKLMEDSFKLIVDRQSRTNMIQSVVYSCGSNFKRTNFSRFYTVVLEIGEVITTAASIRLHPPGLAEIPFIATAENRRNHGYCGFLLRFLETTLAQMGVERILIPAAEDTVMNWQNKFGFIPIDEPLKERITSMNTLMFPKTTRLQKIIQMQTQTQTQRRMTVNDLNETPIEAAYCY